MKGSGNCLCESSILKGKPITYSAICDMPTDVLILDRREFYQIDRTIFKQFCDFQQEFPNDRELRQMH